MKYRKKPVVIEAVQWTGVNVDEVISHLLCVASVRRKDFLRADGAVLPGGILLIDTLEGTIEANPQDWIIKDVKGELYPCKPDIFEMTYEQES